MFEGLTERLTGVFDRLSGRGVLSEKDIDEAMREVRVALLEADVALPVVREFIDKAREAASGEAVIRSVKPADLVVKIVYDGLVEMLGGEGEPEGLRLALNPPSVMLMAGLQGTGKTFHERLPLTGLVLTRTDGDARGGAALSMRAVTGLPIKFLGTGEKIDALDAFDAQRVAGRILGRGDVVALVEKAAAEFDQAKAEVLAKK